MANSLGRTIEKGEVLVIRQEVVDTQYAAVNLRLFVAEEGFGMAGYLRGSAVIGRDCRFEDGVYVMEGGKGSGRYDGFQFDPEETAEWQSLHGKFVVGNSPHQAVVEDNPAAGFAAADPV